MPTFLKEPVYHRLSRGGLLHASAESFHPIQMGQDVDAGIDAQLSLEEFPTALQLSPPAGEIKVGEAMLMGRAGQWICTPGLNRR